MSWINYVVTLTTNSTKGNGPSTNRKCGVTEHPLSVGETGRRYWRRFRSRNGRVQGDAEGLSPSQGGATSRNGLMGLQATARTASNGGVAGWRGRVEVTKLRVVEPLAQTENLKERSNAKGLPWSCSDDPSRWKQGTRGWSWNDWGRAWGKAEPNGAEGVEVEMETWVCDLDSSCT